MESETYDFKCPKINISMSDLSNPSGQLHIRSESSHESQKNTYFNDILNDIISKIVEIPPKNAKNLLPTKKSIKKSSKTAKKRPPTNSKSKDDIPKKILKKVKESQKSTRVVEKIWNRMIKDITKKPLNYLKKKAPHSKKS